MSRFFSNRSRPMQCLQLHNHGCQFSVAKGAKSIAERMPLSLEYNPEQHLYYMYTVSYPAVKTADVQLLAKASIRK